MPAFEETYRHIAYDSESFFVQCRMKTRFNEWKSVMDSSTTVFLDWGVNENYYFRLSFIIHLSFRIDERKIVFSESNARSVISDFLWSKESNRISPFVIRHGFH